LAERLGGGRQSTCLHPAREVELEDQGLVSMRMSRLGFVRWGEDWAGLDDQEDE